MSSSTGATSTSSRRCLDPAPAGKSWLKIDAKKAGTVGGVDLSSLLSQDPSAALDAIANSTTTVTELGTATVGGVSATHYRAHAAGSSGSTHAAGIYNVWVGSDGYIHRVQTVAAAASGSKAAHVVATSTLSGFGDTVDVTVPPASQTYETANGSIPGLGG